VLAAKGVYQGYVRAADNAEARSDILCTNQDISVITTPPNACLLQSHTALNATPIIFGQYVIQVLTTP
jgi:hypothetical protein